MSGNIDHMSRVASGKAKINNTISISNIFLHSVYIVQLYVQIIGMQNQLHR